MYTTRLKFSLSLSLFLSLFPPSLPQPLCIGIMHREKHVVGGEVKPTASMFGEEEEEDPQVLYDKVSSTHLTWTINTPTYMCITCTYN